MCIYTYILFRRCLIFGSSLIKYWTINGKNMLPAINTLVESCTLLPFVGNFYSKKMCDLCYTNDYHWPKGLSQLFIFSFSNIYLYIFLECNSVCHTRYAPTCVQNINRKLIFQPYWNDVDNFVTTGCKVNVCLLRMDSI